jgi:alginate O-acetyltransferase complex protein AlgI
VLFNSLHFLIFFPTVTVLYFTVPQRYRWALLLVASCYFYMALIPVYILVLFFLIGIDYTAGLLIEKSAGVRRRLFLIMSLCANIGMLGFFKYFNFLNSNMAQLYGWLGGQWGISNLHFILPIGLSFHTFQSISYTIEVYRGRQKAEHHLGIYAIYVLFYPQLVAGPIERPQNLLPQFRERHSFEYQRVTDGLKLMMWGFFKKVVIADRLAEAVSLVYDNPTAYHGVPLLAATYFFAIQIYCDFSGYSDIAIGAAQVMGFRLMDNFNRPYHAKSIGEFWQRWHISLSTWFRDYLYSPLGGNRVGKWRWYYNLMIVFLVSGLWHGANWTFVVWGGLHGLYMITSIWTAKWREWFSRLSGLSEYPTIQKVLGVIVTFHLVWFSWIFFRAHSLGEALYVIRHMFELNLSGGLRGLLPAGALILDRVDLLIVLAAVMIMEGVHWLQRHREMRHFLSQKPLWLRWAAYYILSYSIVFFGKFGEQQFIYFQF